jgi:hypothetical protein
MSYYDEEDFQCSVCKQNVNMDRSVELIGNVKYICGFCEQPICDYCAIKHVTPYVGTRHFCSTTCIDNYEESKKEYITKRDKKETKLSVLRVTIIIVSIIGGGIMGYFYGNRPSMNNIGSTIFSCIVGMILFGGIGAMLTYYFWKTIANMFIFGLFFSSVGGCIYGALLDGFISGLAFGFIISLFFFFRGELGEDWRD